MTIEELQAENLRLNEELEASKNEVENYRTKTSELEKDLETVRSINQQYFLKLSAQYKPETEEADEKDEISLEEFAKTLTL